MNGCVDFPVNIRGVKYDHDFGLRHNDTLHNDERLTSYAFHK